MKKLIKGIYTIVDPEESKDIIELCSTLAKSELTIIQYRDKKNSYETKKNIGVKLKKICDKNKKIFIVNDYPELAKDINAHGVHIGQQDQSVEYCRSILNKNQIIGISNNSMSEIKASIKKNVDYLAIGKVFSTSTMGKEDRDVVGVELIQKTKQITNIPIVGIGGINLQNVISVIQAGANAICIVSAITKSKNPMQVTKNINNILNN